MKQIPFATKYLINEVGEVYSNKSGTLKKLKSCVDTSTYARIGIINNEGKNKKYLVHRLVAITYIPNPNNLPEVNHKDGNKENNSVTNLEWVNREQNQQHAFINGLNSNLGSKNGKATLLEEEVVEIYKALLEGQLTGTIAKRFNTTKEIVRTIKYKASWGHLLDKFPNIDVKYKTKSISDSTATWVCSKLQEGYSVAQILESTSNERITDDIVRDIKRRRSFKHISVNYNW